MLATGFESFSLSKIVATGVATGSDQELRKIALDIAMDSIALDVSASTPDHYLDLLRWGFHLSLLTFQSFDCNSPNSTEKLFSHPQQSGADFEASPIDTSKTLKLLRLGVVSVHIVAKLAMSRVFLRVSEVVNAAARRTIVSFSQGRLNISAERGHSVNSAFGFTGEMEGSRICSKCDAFSLDCEHVSGRLLRWHKLTADVDLEPRPESAIFALGIHLQLSGLLGVLERFLYLKYDINVVDTSQ